MLTVLKSFAERPSAGMMSFPMAGFTLAVDFPNRGEETRTLMARLESIVMDSGGRLYPAKDGLMSAASFRRGYPELDAFMPFMEPNLSSAFAQRVGIKPPVVN
jgi:L-gulonolactone oxidase